MLGSTNVFTYENDKLMIEMPSGAKFEVHAPHKDLENRDFVLVPLQELNKDMILPSGKTIEEALKNINNTTEVIEDET